MTTLAILFISCPIVLIKLLIMIFVMSIYALANFASSNLKLASLYSDKVKFANISLILA